MSDPDLPVEPKPLFAEEEKVPIPLAEYLDYLIFYLELPFMGDVFEKNVEWTDILSQEFYRINREGKYDAYFKLIYQAADKRQSEDARKILREFITRQSYFDGTLKRKIQAPGAFLKVRIRR